MKNFISLQFLLLFFCGNIEAQFYSSGNNVIAGNNVGIGINTPSAMLHVKRNSSGGNLFLENSNPNAFQSFRLFNDVPTNFATFTKYGSTFPGGYTGISTLYPFANLLGFGNNGPMLNASTGNIGFAITKGGTNKLKIHIDAVSERVGIGGSAIPAANVHVNNSLVGDTIKLTNNTTGHTSSDGLEIRTTGVAASLTNRENSTLDFGTNNVSRMRINADGKVVIGAAATPAGYRLFVEEGILTEKVKVAIKTSAEWSDYVFSNEYQLAKLSEVEDYVNEFQHLPGMPSAQEVVENGIDVAKMDAKLLAKIEELTLYLIEMNARMLKMEKALEEFKK